MDQVKTFWAILELLALVRAWHMPYRNSLILGSEFFHGPEHYHAVGVVRKRNRTCSVLVKPSRTQALKNANDSQHLPLIICRFCPFCVIFVDCILLIERWTGALQVQPRFRIRHNFISRMLHCPISEADGCSPSFWKRPSFNRIAQRWIGPLWPPANHHTYLHHTF